MGRPHFPTLAIAEARIRACHQAGLVTDAAVGQALGCSGSCIAHWRQRLGLPAHDLFALHWEQRHGRGSYAALLRLLTLRVSTRVLQERYHISRQYAYILRQRAYE